MTTPAYAVPMSKDTSSCATPTPTPLTPPEDVIKLDIEHAIVEDDPRIWSNTRKVGLLFRPWTPTRLTPSNRRM
ncbi:hypothetical protein J3R82DRAFT_9963 [Butyriboletus roseoflavus]|nr:hypothetical protein J3R82DRAFT_9963 [Butyriboletus roseoflavus]